MHRIIIICLLLTLVATSALAGHAHLEKEYQAVWCEQQAGQVEVILEDTTRVDCVTATHAVEVDFAAKWAESIGQALFYALKTGKEPGVLLILERPSDIRYQQRLDAIAEEYGITVWTITPAELTVSRP